MSVVRRRSVRILAASAALVASSALTALTPARADDTGTPSGTAAVLTPLLRLFQFGDVTGLPLACNAVTALLPSLAPQSSNFAVAVANQCADLSARGGNYLAQAIEQSRALVLINPLVNPVIDLMSTNLEKSGQDYATSLAPFGPTVAGLGGTVAFFEGTSDGSGS